MHNYKLTLLAPNCNFELITRIVRARDEQHARQMAADSPIGDKMWLDKNRTRCEIYETWDQDMVNEPKSGGWF